MRKEKRIKMRATAAALLAAVLAAAVPAGNVRAEAAERDTVVECMALDGRDAVNPGTAIERELTVHYSDVLNQTPGTEVWQENPYRDFGAAVGKDEYFYYKYKFDLDSLCYVNFYANSAAAADWWQGDYSVYLGTSAGDLTCPIEVKKDADGSSPINMASALEKGTYYLIVASRITYDGYTGKRENPAWNKHGSVSVCINAQRLQRTGGLLGASKQDAITARNGKVSTGYITGVMSAGKTSVAVPSQWFKITTTADAGMNTTVAVARPQGYDDRMGVTAKLYNGLGILMQTEKSKENSNAVSFVSPSLPAGDYYIEVTYPRFCEISVLPNVTALQQKERPLPKPASFQAAAGKKKVTLRWKKCKGAAGYDIYRSTKKASGYKKIATVKKTTYTDKKGLKSKKTYYYKIRAYKSKKNQSKFSSVIKVRVK